MFTTSHRPNATATNATNLTAPCAAPYPGIITAESKLPAATAANPACHPTQMHITAMATTRPEGSPANNASKTAAAPIAPATTRRCLVDVSSIQDPLETACRRLRCQPQSL